MNPLVLYAMAVTTQSHGQHGTRIVVDSDPNKLQALGEFLVANKPEEATHVSFVVVGAEGVS